MPYGRRAMRRYRKSNTQRKGRRFFRSYGKAYNTNRNSGGYNSKYRRTKVKVPTRVLPDYTLVKMKDSRLIILDAGQVPQPENYSVSNTFISGNDMYNCWQQSIGQPTLSQPTGFDQWAAFYRNFIVHKSSIRVTPIYFIDDGTDATPQPFQLTITPVDSTNLQTFQTSFDEQPYSKFRIYNGVLPTASSTTVQIFNTGNQTMRSVYNSMMTKKILGYKDLSDVNEVQGPMYVDTTLTLQGPDEQFYWNIEAKSLVLAPTGAPLPEYALRSLAVKVDIYYKAQLLNRRSVVDSGDDQES